MVPPAVSRDQTRIGIGIRLDFIPAILTCSGPMARSLVPQLPPDLPDGVKATLLPLNPRQLRFVMAYCGDEAFGNGTRAAKVAGYSAKSAYTTQNELLRNPKVKAAVEAWFAHTQMGAMELTARVADMARIDAGAFLTYDTTSKSVKFDGKQLGVYSRWIRSFECDPITGRITKLVAHDAQRAQATLAKILQLFSDGPQFVFRLQARRASNDEVLAKLEEARVRALTAGGSRA